MRSSKKMKRLKAITAKGERKYKKIRQEAKSGLATIQQKISPTYKRVKNYAKKHPVQTAAVAATVGAAVGALVSSRIGKKRKK